MDEIKKKRCTRCKEELPVTNEYFDIKSRTYDGFRSRCNKCRREVEGRPPKKVTRDGYKRCTKCDKEFPATPDHFYRSSSIRSGLNARCKTCADSEHKDFVAECRQKPVEQTFDETKMKQCYKCQEEFPSTPQYFLPSPVEKSGLYPCCRKCENKRRGEYRRKNLEKSALYDANYRDSNRDRMHERDRKKYYENHEETLKKQRKARSAPSYSLRASVHANRRRTRLREAAGSHTYEDIQLICQ